MRASELRLKVASQGKEAFPNPFRAVGNFFKTPISGPLAAERTMGNLMLGTGAVATAGAGAMAGWDAAESAIGKGVAAASARMGRNRGYKKMLAATGEEDTETRQNAFNTLHTFAPDLAKDPMVAGTFVKRVVDFDENIDPTWVKTLVETQQRHRPTTSRGPSGAGAVFGGTIARGLQTGMTEAQNAARYNQDYALKSRAADIADAREGRDVEEAGRKEIIFDSGSPFQREQEQIKARQSAAVRATTKAVAKHKDISFREQARDIYNLNLQKAQDEAERTRVIEREYDVDPMTGARSLAAESERMEKTPRYPGVHGWPLKKKASLDRARSLRARSTRASDLRMRFGG